MAGNVITVMPVLLAFLLAQRSFIQLPDLERGEGIDGDAGDPLERVTKVYDGDVLAVDDVSLEVADGRVHGPRRAVGLRQVDAAADDRRARAGDGGTVWIGDDDVTTLEPPDRDIAMVFQSYALYPHKTVRENLAFGLRRRKVPKEEIAERVDRMAAMLGLGELMERKPAALSGGQRQRVAMGRALVREPRAFLHGRAALEPRREAAHDACAASSRACTSGCRRRPSTSPTTRSRR